MYTPEDARTSQAQQRRDRHPVPRQTSGSTTGSWKITYVDADGVESTRTERGKVVLQPDWCTILGPDNSVVFAVKSEAITVEPA